MAYKSNQIASTAFERNLGFIIHDIARLMRLDFERRVRTAGVTRAQWFVLAHLIRADGQTQTALAEETDMEKAARAWFDQGPGLVIFTRGPKGAIAYSRNDVVEVEGVSVKVADTVGAGDTFNAGLLASLRRDRVLDKSAIRALSADAIANALRLGAKAAAVTVSRPGANPPWAHEIGL